MKSVIILLALVAFCQAAPLDVKESAPETSTLGVGPIAPDVISEPKPTEGKVVLLRDDVLNRQKRDEHKKPDSVKAHELLQHDPHRPLTSPPKPDNVKAHEGLQHSAHKREAHHEPGHQEDAPKEVPHDAPEVALPKKEKRETDEKPDSVEAKESLAHHEPALTLQAETLKTLTDGQAAPEKKVKREAHHEEDHKEQPQTEDLTPHALPSAAPAIELPKKEKRETEQKPDSVQTKESLDHHAHAATLQVDTLKTLTEAHPAEKKAKREAHHEEGHSEQHQTEDLSLPHTLPSAAPAVDLAKKEKRETQEKPDSDKPKESLDHHGLGAADPTDIVKSLVGVHPASDLTKKQEKRDIPVPTQTKATADPAATTKLEGGSTTPSTPHFKRPVPVDVLLHQKHDEKSTSSSEESKESKEKVKA